MRIYKGTYVSNDRPVHWVETTTRWEFTLDQLIDGLCSHYHRDRVEGDEELPERLTQTAIMRTVREEYERRGTDNVWTWSDNEDSDCEEARAWARDLVLAVLPDLEIPGQ